MVAYIILAHNKITQLERLIKKVNYEENSIIVHIDKKVSNEQFSSIKNKFYKDKNVIFMDKRYNCVWGDFSIVKATYSCIDYLLSLNKKFTHAVLLSGMDFPIKSNKDIDEFFENNSKTDFIQCSIDSIYKNDSKFNMYYFKFAHLFTNAKIQKLVFRAQYKLSYLLNIKRNHPLFTEIYFGSQWWALTKETLIQINEFIINNKNYMNFYKNTNIPDEFFFQTIVGNFHNKNLVNENLHYMQWEKDSWHPNTFKTTDINSVLESEKLFARKFDEDLDNEIICYLERNL